MKVTSTRYPARAHCLVERSQNVTNFTKGLPLSCVLSGSIDNLNLDKSRPIAIRTVNDPRRDRLEVN